jgi:hypothetical protein
LTVAASRSAVTWITSAGQGAAVPRVAAVRGRALPIPLCSRNPAGALRPTQQAAPASSAPGGKAADLTQLLETLAAVVLPRPCARDFLLTQICGVLSSQRGLGAAYDALRGPPQGPDFVKRRASCLHHAGFDWRRRQFQAVSFLPARIAQGFPHPCRARQ